MNYTIVEEGNYFHQNHNDIENEQGNEWGFFVVLDEPVYLNPIKFKYPKKYFHFSIPQTLTTIREDLYEDSCCLENEKDDQKKKEKAIIMQIYSGLTICALALYICLSS